MSFSLVLAKGFRFVLTAGFSSYACCFCREVYTPAYELCALCATLFAERFG
jgi:hypothetical protein